jgi:hypothetical protein
MKVQRKLQGTFHRTLLDGAESGAVSLADFMREVQAVATQTRRRSPQLLRQSFGLDFLPQPVLINLLQQANGVATEKQLYQVPCLQLLHPVESDLTPQVGNTYSYHFTCPEATFNLSRDNPQLPTWAGSDSEQPGIYTIILECPHHIYIDDDLALSIWQQAINQWQTLPETDKIHIALQSISPTCFCLPTSPNPQMQIWIESQDLSLDLRAAITFLRLGSDDTSALSQTTQSLVGEYRATHSLPVSSFKLPASLNPAQTLSPAQGFVIGRGSSRSALQKIISEAQQFLLISSYRIEDEETTELICQQSQQLPQGVWILTDLGNEVIDVLDAQLSNHTRVREEYQRSTQRKKTCLRMLLDANIPIRSGAFHLKTIISERYAYLGSCNLTGGSLDFNLEAGIAWRNNPAHAQLINLFRHFWQQRSRDEVIPVSNLDGFRLRSLNRSPQEISENYPNFLTPSQYKRDLIEELTQFRGEVAIYTRSFQPSPEISRFLNVLDTRVFVDSQLMPSYSRLNIQPIDNLHAKITRLGNKVAYIGGINFNFSDSALSLTDLMYKTTDSQVISQIRQRI